MDKELYTPKEAAKILGISVMTLQRWDRSGKIKCLRTPTNRRRIHRREIEKLLGDRTITPTNKKLVIYGRVSSNEQKKKGDLDRQIEFIKQKLDLRVYNNIEIITDVGSGLNDKRKGLMKVMKQAQEGKMTDLAVRYKDRLTRFGYHYLALFFKGYNINVHILDDTKDNKTVYEELTDDLLSIITSFSGKLYGIRSGKNKILKNKIKVAIDDVANLPDED
ncbi:MAG: IS607 family transposase [archaeon]